MTIRDIEMEMISKILTNNNILIGELGNQRLIYKDYNGTAKNYFKKFNNIDHYSFDLNGKDGSILIDLSKPIDKKWHNKFNIITNAGTSEHITDAQIQVFRNMHYMCKIGGYIIHSIPLIGSWKGHCPHRYSKSFIKSISKDNYEIIYDEINKRSNNYLVCGIVKKLRNRFIVGEWVNEIKRSNDYKLNTDNFK